MHGDNKIVIYLLLLFHTTSRCSNVTLVSHHLYCVIRLGKVGQSFLSMGTLLALTFF
jgi:hypothetical protein